MASEDLQKLTEHERYMYNRLQAIENDIYTAEEDYLNVSGWVGVTVSEEKE